MQCISFSLIDMNLNRMIQNIAKGTTDPSHSVLSKFLPKRSFNVNFRSFTHIFVYFIASFLRVSFACIGANFS